MKKETLEIIAQKFSANSGELFFVGGCVRDEIMKRPTEDVDICIVGIENRKKVNSIFAEILYHKHCRSVSNIHGGFPIWIVDIDGEKFEFAMARTEKKFGTSHQDFLTDVKNVTIHEDLRRRDFTINAIAKHVVTGEIIDPYGGVNDIKNGILRPVSRAFSEDPLRVIRAARFLAKLELSPSRELIKTCLDMATPGVKSGISNERVGVELMKTFKTAKKPSLFFNFLYQVNWLSPWFNEVEILKGIPQSPKHHPEGDVWNHTMHCIDATPMDWFMRATMLCHDLGKATTTKINGVPFSRELQFKLDHETKISSIGHEAAGVIPTINMLKKINFCSHFNIKRIAMLVEMHMVRMHMSNKNAHRTIRQVQRHIMKLGLNWGHLVEVCFYDIAGRPPKVVDWNQHVVDMHLSYLGEIISRDLMKPVVTGKKLLEIGLQPGPDLRILLEHALKLQDRGTLNCDNWKTVLYAAHNDIFKKHGVKFLNLV